MVNFQMLRGFNPGQSYTQGFALGQGVKQSAEDQRMLELSQKIQEQMNNPEFNLVSSSDFGQLMSTRPDLAQGAMQRFEAMSDARKEEYIQDMVKARDAVRFGEPQNAIQILNDRVSKVVERGGTADDSVRALQLLTDNPQNFVEGVDNMVRARTGYETDPTGSQRSFAPSISTPRKDPESGQMYVIVTDPNTQTTKRVDIEGAKALTPDQEIANAVKQKLLQDSTQIGRDAFDQLKIVNSEISLLEDGISALDKGAQSGFVDRYLPSLRQSTIELENIANKLGLNVISATTFGALSEGELRLAMDTAVPRNLQPQALKAWFKERVAAQKKLREELKKMAITLGKGKTTFAEYLESNSTNAQGNEQDEFAGFSIVE